MFVSFFNSIIHVKKYFLPCWWNVCDIRKDIKIDLIRTFIIGQNWKQKQHVVRPLILNSWIYLRKRVSEMYFNIHHTLQTTYAYWVYFSSSHWILKQTTVDSPCFAISDYFFVNKNQVASWMFRILLQFDNSYIYDSVRDFFVWCLLSKLNVLVIFDKLLYMSG